MLLGFDAPENLLRDAMQAPDVIASSAESELQRREPDPGKPILDPRDGDAEDDASSPKQKSLLAIAGSLLAEISLTKLLLAWIASIGLPAAILGLAPLIATAWVGSVFVRVLELYGIGPHLCFWLSSPQVGSAGALCFASRRQISGRSTRSRFSPDTPWVARQFAI